VNEPTWLSRVIAETKRKLEIFGLSCREGVEYKGGKPTASILYCRDDRGKEVEVLIPHDEELINIRIRRGKWESVDELDRRDIQVALDESLPDVIRDRVHVHSGSRMPLEYEVEVLAYDADAKSTVLRRSTPQIVKAVASKLLHPRF